MADLTREDFAKLRCQWFGSVYEIADIEYQRQTWLTPPDTSPHSSYVEFCCSYPNADQLEFALERGHLSFKEFELLTRLESELISHQAPGSDDYDHRAILEDPAWHAVAARAELTRRQLLAVIEDPVERSS